MTFHFHPAQLYAARATKRIPADFQVEDAPDEFATDEGYCVVNFDYHGECFTTTFGSDEWNVYFSYEMRSTGVTSPVRVAFAIDTFANAVRNATQLP